MNITGFALSDDTIGIASSAGDNDTNEEKRLLAALQRNLLTFEAGSHDDLGAAARIMWRGDCVGSIALSTIGSRSKGFYVYGRDDIQVGTKEHAFYHALLNVTELRPGAFVDYTSFADWLEAIGFTISDFTD